VDRLEELRASRTPFIRATVVRAQKPTSAKAGDSALVLPDGTLEGFVGGTCAESTVRLQGLRLLETGDSILLRISPGAEETQSSEEGLIEVNNPCLSGGSLEIFMEAVLPAPLVQVYGDAPVARALQRIGAAAGYDLRLGGSLEPDTSAVVIASHGRNEIEALEAAVRAEVPYIALVASRRRGDAVLKEAGLTRDRVHTPAGLDIGARTASDIAISILAEIISSRGSAPPARVEIAIDPICGMEVAVTPDALHLVHNGETIYFCAPGCRATYINRHA
jgi:xanthine dehydrogenase accessory factor